MATVADLLRSAQLILDNGNPNVIDNFYQRVAPNEELRVLPPTTTEPAF